MHNTCLWYISLKGMKVALSLPLSFAFLFMGQTALRDFSLATTLAFGSGLCLWVGARRMNLSSKPSTL